MNLLPWALAAFPLHVSTPAQLQHCWLLLSELPALKTESCSPRGKHHVELQELGDAGLGLTNPSSAQDYLLFGGIEMMKYFISCLL